MPQIPQTNLSVGDELHGFRVEKITPLEELRVLAIEARHPKSGARFLHLYTEDEESLFSAAFRTPPPDDTGLPHILEHTVLCGSKRYPVKDPFVELLKTSLATFLNAMTYPDKTVYPCASMNEKDFFNLAGVYCDAVFHPLITEKHFKQEGHHYEFAEPGNTGSPLIIKGIVYNEMKGAYSDLDGIIDRNLTRSICPDNAYGKDSGGDPEIIPELTYEQFTNFHARYYHPSNALLFVHGNIPTEKHMKFLDDEYLSKFDAISIDTSIDEQPRWSEPVRATIPYPVGPEDTAEKKTAITVNFLTNDLTDPIKSLSMGILDYYLLGNAASPLRKALIDSKLGEELTDSGYANYQRDTFFTVGLKGTESEKEDEIVEIVFSVCSELADN
ncbi:MAG: insulinase family protein, partial [Planctomycetes bacterium]|nr:insulinase family protein [Planctomycetota bacterium]